jgi:hypothetical protein
MCPLELIFHARNWDASVTMRVLGEIDLPLVPKAFEGRIDRVILDRLVDNHTYARLFSFVECGGFYAGEAFLNWIREKLAAKNIQATDTLSTFAQKTGADLSIVASDTTDMEMLVLNHRTAPNVPVCQRCSHVDEYPFCVAASGLAGRMGFVHGPQEGR